MRELGEASLLDRPELKQLRVLRAEEAQVSQSRTPRTLQSYPKAKATYKWRWMNGDKKLGQTATKL